MIQQQACPLPCDACSQAAVFADVADRHALRYTTLQAGCRVGVMSQAAAWGLTLSFCHRLATPCAPA